MQKSMRIFKQQIQDKHKTKKGSKECFGPLRMNEVHKYLILLRKLEGRERKKGKEDPGLGFLERERTRRGDGNVREQNSGHVRKLRDL